jgi:hypothetical protein
MSTNGGQREESAKPTALTEPTGRRGPEPPARDCGHQQPSTEAATRALHTRQQRASDLADVHALDPPTERVRADRVRERTSDVHAGAPVGQPLPRHVPGDVNVDLSARPCWSHRHHRADSATSRAIIMAVLDGASQRFTRRRIGGAKPPAVRRRRRAEMCD